MTSKSKQAFHETVSARDTSKDLQDGTHILYQNSRAVSIYYEGGTACKSRNVCASRRMGYGAKPPGSSHLL